MCSQYLLFSFLHFIGVTIAFKILCFIAPEFLRSYFTSIVSLVTILLISKVTFTFTKRRFLNENVRPANRGVFITGCDTGFGHLLAKRLDSKGFRVFAGCLFPEGEGAEQLKKSCTKRLQIIGLDVTSDESVENARKVVTESLGLSDLWAIVNNAGISRGFSLSYSTIEDFSECLNVNCLGAVRVTKAFLSLLKKSKGRVVNVTSIAGRTIGPMYLAYFTSKFAAVGFNGCLRLELDLFGISVVSIEPEFFRTPLFNKEKMLNQLSSTINSVSSDVKKEYGAAYEKLIQQFGNLVLNLSSTKIHLVVDDMEKAVCAEHPDIIYRPRRNYFLRFVSFAYATLPENIIEIITKIVLYVYGFNKALKQK